MKKILILVLILSSILMASIGKITSFKGSVNIQRDTQSILAKLNLEINKNDIITTKKNSNAIIQFNDGTIITIGKNSSLNVENYIYDTNNKEKSATKFVFLKGTFKSVTGAIGKFNPDKFKLQTRTANIGIRGTVTLANQEIVACTAGANSVEVNNKTVNINAGEYVSTDLADVSAPQKLTQEVLDMLNNQLNTSMPSSKKDSASPTTVVSPQLESQANDSKTATESGGGDSSGSGGSGH